MNKLFDVLEICLQELENGADLETILARYPDLAAELRPILKASIMARSRNVTAPSRDSVRRGRAKLLQHASEMRERKAAPRRRMIPIFQRLAISLALTSVFLVSGTGLVSASSSALPGENLYPVKRTWEDVRLFFVFDQQAHAALKNEFENERLQEVSNLLMDGRDETIQFAGIFRQVKGVTYISGVTVLIPANLQVPADGAAVTVTGKTNAQGFVEIESIQLLPDGAILPLGKPVEADNESSSNSNSSSGSGLENGANSNSGSSSENGTDVNSNSGSGSESGTGSGSTNEAQGSTATATPKSDSQSFEMKGTIESVSNNTLVINGQTLNLDNAKINGVLTSGANVEIKGYYAADGSFIVTDVKVKDAGSGGSSSNENQNSNPGSNSNDNSGSGSKDNGSNGNDGGGGSGGDGGGDGGGGG